MTRISTIILISLILSCIDNIMFVTVAQNISYTFQNNNDLDGDEIFNTSMYIANIVQSSRPIYLDISICDYCGRRMYNRKQYIQNLFQTAGQIFANHRIKLSVMHQDMWCEENKVTPSHQLNTTDYEDYFSSISQLPDALVVLEYVFIIID
ncbi:hypothetical protein HZS_4858 [Henneguya salminicola]|nr:hypothetical protein HZS_4858 [Henneguya salminicola]